MVRHAQDAQPRTPIHTVTTLSASHLSQGHSVGEREVMQASTAGDDLSPSWLQPPNSATTGESSATNFTPSVVCVRDPWPGSSQARDRWQTVAQEKTTK